MKKIFKLLPLAYANHINPKVIRVAFWFLRFELFVKNLNLFHIYALKGTPLYKDKAKYRIFANPRLRIERSEVSVWKRLWRNFLLLWYIYFLLKCLLTFVLSRIAAGELIFSFRPKRSNEPYPSGLVEKSKQILNYTGNPMIQNEGIMIFYFITAPIKFIIMNSCQEYYFTRVVPFDSPELRIVFEPKREIERVNLLLRQKLNSILNSMKLYKIHLNSADVKRNNTDKISRRDLDIVMANLLGYERQALEYKFLMMRENPELESMRPSFYRLSFIKKYRTWISLLIMKDMFNWIQRLPSIWDFLVRYEIEKRCEVRNLSLCDFDHTYSLPDKIFLLEIWVGFRFDLLSDYFHFLVYFGSIIKFYCLMKDIRSTAKNCLKHIIKSPHLHGKESSRSSLNDQVLKAILKISVAQDDFSNGVKFLELIQTIELVTVLNHVILIANIELPSESQFMLAVFTYGFGITLANICALIIASCSAEVIKTEREFWSILEQLKRLEGARQRRFDSRNVEQRMGLDFLVVLWQKMTFSAWRSHQDYVLKILGWSFTFEDILNLNFSCLSLFTFFYTYR